MENYWRFELLIYHYFIACRILSTKWQVQKTKTKQNHIFVKIKIMRKIPQRKIKATLALRVLPDSWVLALIVVYTGYRYLSSLKNHIFDTCLHQKKDNYVYDTEWILDCYIMNTFLSIICSNLLASLYYGPFRWTLT